MSKRCGCTDQGDEIVFGQCRKCFPNPEEPRDRPYEITLDEDERRGH